MPSIRVPLASALLVVMALSAAHCEPRAAAVYSAFKDGGYSYRAEQAFVFDELGWELDTFENTAIAQLMSRLDQYTVIVFSTAYNYENAQDLSALSDQWRAYVRRGGCLVVTDANYGPMFGWLMVVDPTLRWVCRSQPNPHADDEPAFVDTDHPLMKGVRAPIVPWTMPAAWSQAYSVLVADAGRRPIVAYREIGKGVVVVSSAYRQHKWPNAAFVGNLAAWAADPGRQKRVAAREAAAQQLARSVPELTIPKLAQTPRVDGRLEPGEWDGAATIDHFVDMRGSEAVSQRTRCRVATVPDGLAVAFECSDSDLEHVVDSVRRRDDAAWTDDCVEVFLAPEGEDGDSLHFIVSAGGAQYDERNGDPAWDRYWLAATGRSPGSWTAELFIPFTALDICAAKPPAAIWRGNFYREYQARPHTPLELSGWSPTFANFDVRSRFGLLKGIVADATRYPLEPAMVVSIPERWYVGENRFEVGLRSLAGPAKGLLELVGVSTGERLARVDEVAVQAGRRETVPMQFTLKGDTERPVQAVLIGEGGRVLAASRVIHARPAPAMEAWMVEPAFRGSIQPADPTKQLHVSGRVGLATGEDLRVRASLTGEAQIAPLWQQSQPVAPKARFDLRTPLPKLAQGRYQVRVDLEDGQYALLAHQMWPLRVTGPAPVQVTFDSRRVCYVNGEAFFPIGLYHVSEPVVDIVNKRAKEIDLPLISVESMLKDCRDHGFNCVVRGWGMPGEAYLEAAADSGLWVMPEVGSPDAETLAQMVETANRYPNVLMWYGVDEPSGERLTRAIESHERFVVADPHRPVSAAINNPAMLPGALQAYDLFMMDPYLIRTASLEGIAGWAGAAMETGQGRSPLWMVPQAFALDSRWDEPTNEELRCQAYLSIAHGATGLVWYAYFTTERFSGNPKGRNQWFLPDSHLWPYFTKLNAEIQSLTPVILTGDRLGPIQCSDATIHTHLWKHEGSRYLVAVNPTDRPVECSFAGLDARQVEVMFEDRKLTNANGGLQDSFGPMGVHVYRF